MCSVRIVFMSVYRQSFFSLKHKVGETYILLCPLYFAFSSMRFSVGSQKGTWPY